jgi:hypothetical protein
LLLGVGQVLGVCRLSDTYDCGPILEQRKLP